MKKHFPLFAVLTAAVTTGFAFAPTAFAGEMKKDGMSKMSSGKMEKSDKTTNMTDKKTSKGMKKNSMSMDKMNDGMSK